MTRSSNVIVLELQLPAILTALLCYYLNHFYLFMVNFHFIGDLPPMMVKKTLVFNYLHFLVNPFNFY